MCKPCETCMQWAEHHYWEILDDRGKCFFKVIMDDLHEMTIPKKFAACFKAKISRTIQLEARNGSICDVAVRSRADKIILQSGWKEFVNEHDLGRGDFLVFRYNGDSRFKVGIFDLTGCEKASSCVNMKNPRPTETIESSYEHHSRPSVDNTMKKSFSSTPSEKLGDAPSSQDDFIANNVPPYMIGSNAHLTQVQEDKVEENVQAINSDNPILVTIMCRTHVNREQCKFEFLKKYADTCLPEKKQSVVLQRHGERWEMFLNVASGRRRLIHGWRQFVLDNDLQIGDLCLFDLLNDKKMCTMKVHIIRARKRNRR